MKRKRLWIILGIVVVLFAVGYVVIRASTPAAAQPATVQTGRVTRATLLSTVDSTGSVTPESKVTLSFGTSGTVDKVNVQPGNRVKQGDVLAELDTNSLQLQVAQQEQAYLSQQAAYSMTLKPDPDAVASAQAALNSASAAYKAAQQKYASDSTDQVTVSCNNLDNIKQTYDDAVTAYNNYVSNWHVQVNGTADISPQKAQLNRAKAAYDQALANCSLAKNSINNSAVQSALAQLEQAKTNLDNLVNPTDRTTATAKAQLDQAKLAVDSARQQLANAKILAPFDGVVTQVNALVGGLSSSGTIVMADDSHLHVGMLVDETQIGQIKVGQPAQVTFDALPGTTVTGTVSLINPAGTVSQGVVNYLVRIDLNPTTAPLKLDMTANGRAILDTHANVLAVPGGAIRSDTKGYFVNMVNPNGDATRVDVTTGFTDGSLTEVSGNLRPGQQVYLSEPPRRQGGGPGLFGIRLGGG